MTRPLIVLPTGLDLESPRFYLQRHYAEALYRAGATPMHLALIPEPAYVDELLARCDALMLTGSGSDVDPSRYGQEPHPKLGPVVWERDEIDALLLKAAEERQMPVMAICYGIQSLNVYRGGTLIQDIPSQLANAMEHQQRFSSGTLGHSIEIKPGSVLARLAGGLRLRVNSFHHQAIDRPGRGLEPIAWAPDGVVEAVMNTASEQLILGVQWHPERCFDEDRFCHDLLTWFVAQVERRLS